MLTQKTKMNCNNNARFGMSKTGPLKLSRANDMAKTAMMMTDANPTALSGFWRLSFTIRSSWGPKPESFC